MGNGWNIRSTPPNTVRLRSTGPGPHRLVITRLPDPEPAGVGKAHWVGDTSPHKPPKERRGERERERERDPHHELAIQFMVFSAQDVPRKEGGALAILCLGSCSGRFSTACALSTLKRGGVLAFVFLGGGLFRPVCRPHGHFLPLKEGKCRPFFFGGVFRAVCRPHARFLPSKEGECWHFFGGVFFGPFVDRMCVFYSKIREVPAIFVLGPFSARLSTACALYTFKGKGSAGNFVFVWGGLYRPVC